MRNGGNQPVRLMLKLSCVKYNRHQESYLLSCIIKHVSADASESGRAIEVESYSRVCLHVNFKVLM